MDRKVLWTKELGGNLCCMDLWNKSKPLFQYELMHLETLSEYQTNNGFYGITLDGGNVITCQVMEGKDCDWFVGMVRVTLDLGNVENNRGNMNNTKWVNQCISI